MEKQNKFDPTSSLVDDVDAKDLSDIIYGEGEYDKKLESIKNRKVETIERDKSFLESLLTFKDERKTSIE